MKIPELRKDPIVIEWLTIINTRPNTERNYLLGFQWFTEWTGQDPENLLLEAEQEIKDGILPRQRSLKKHITGFKKFLQDRGNAPLTNKVYLTGVKSFYSSFDIEIPKQARAGSKAQTLKENNDIPTKEDLQEVLKVCDPLEKALVLMGVSSGLSANEIMNLRIKDFKKGYDPETEITTFDLRRGKVGFDFVTFISPEASRAVWEYLDFRGRIPKTGEKKRIEQLEKQKILSDENYLFIKRRIEPSFLQNHNDELRKHQRNTLVKVYEFISDKAQKNTKPGAWNLIRSHNMRKFFNSALLNAGADSFFIEFFMGHTLDETHSAYFRASPEKLRDLYSKYISVLTIAAEYDPKRDPNFQNLKQLSEAQARVIESSSEAQKKNRDEIQELRAEMENNKKTNENLTELFKVLLENPGMKEKWDRVKNISQDEHLSDTSDRSP